MGGPPRGKNTGGLPGRAAALASATYFVLQEIPFHLELPDMLVELGNQDLVSLLLSFQVSAKDASSSLRYCPLPGTHLAEVNLEPVGNLRCSLLTFQGF